MVDFTLPLGYNKTVTIIHYTKKLLGWGKSMLQKNTAVWLPVLQRNRGYPWMRRWISFTVPKSNSLCGMEFRTCTAWAMSIWQRIWNRNTTIWNEEPICTHKMIDWNPTGSCFESGPGRRTVCRGLSMGVMFNKRAIHNRFWLLRLFLDNRLSMLSWLCGSGNGDCGDFKGTVKEH